MDVPKKNFIIYDGACGFCNKGIERLKFFIGDSIDYIPRQSLEKDFYNISLEDFNKSIKYFEHKNSAVNTGNLLGNPYVAIFDKALLYSAAFAVFKALANNPIFAWLLFLYRYLPLFQNFSEAVYAVIARYRYEILRFTQDDT